MSEPFDLFQRKADTRSAGSARMANQAFGSKRRFKAVRWGEDQRVGPRMSVIGNDQRGARGSPEVSVEIHGVEERAIGWKHSDTFEVTGDCVPDSARGGVGVPGFFCQGEDVDTYPLGMANYLRVGGDDEDIVDRLAATNLDHHVEKELLGKAGPIGIRNHARETLVGAAELLDREDRQSAKSFCSEHSTEKASEGQSPAWQIPPRLEEVLEAFATLSEGF